MLAIVWVFKSTTLMLAPAAQPPVWSSVTYSSRLFAWQTARRWTSVHARPVARVVAGKRVFWVEYLWRVGAKRERERERQRETRSKYYTFD